MVKKTVLCGLLVILGVMCGCSKPESVKMVATWNEFNDPTKLSFVRGDKTLFSYTPKDGRKLGFMTVLFADEEKRRFEASSSISPNNMDYTKYLVDIKGDGDKRHLLLYDWHGGNSAFGWKGFLIDTKADFKVLGEFSAGETVDIDLHNPTFYQTSEIAYFGVNGSAMLHVAIKLTDAPEPQVMLKRSNLISIPYYRALQADNRELALYTIYCDAACFGYLHLAPKLAAKLGFTVQEINTWGVDCTRRILQDPLWKHLKKINPNYK